jgi:PAS domain S-box-containing protein
MTSLGQGAPAPAVGGPPPVSRAWIGETAVLGAALLAVAAWLHRGPSSPASDWRVLLARVLVLLLVAGIVWRVSAGLRARFGFEKALWETEEQYRAYFEESPVGKSMTAPDGRLLRVNRALCTMLGYSADELTRIDFASVTHPDDLAANWAAVQSLLAGEKATWTAEKRFLRKDGSVVWAGVVSSLRRDEAGRPVCFMTHIQDISEKRRVEEALRASEARFRDAFLLSPDAVNINRLDDGRYVSVNASFTRIMGYAAEEVLGRTSTEIGIWKDPGDRTRLIAQLSAEGRVENFEAPFRGKDGSSRFGLMSAAVIQLEGEPHILSVTRDLTDRKRLEEQALTVQTERLRVLEEADRSRRALLSLVEDLTRTESALRRSEGEFRRLSEELEVRVEERTSQLERTNRELEAFSYSVSHDLRAPLRAIDGFSRMVVDRYGAGIDTEGKRLLGVVRDNATRMARLIDDLLAFSRSGRSEMHFSRLDMSEMARAAFAEAVPDPAQVAKVDFRVGDLPSAQGDAALLRQVWVNLLSNAVKFSVGKERPVVEVEGALEGDLAVYRVRDNGAGFDMAYAGKLFGVFQRLHGMNEFDGTGVGLALVQRIVSRHGGRAWAEGAVGRGATVSFELPAKRQEPPGA